jgi:hypothetical protein
MKDERMDQEAGILDGIENDSRWLYSHYDGIREEFSDKFIAVKNCRVIGSDEGMEGLVKKLESMGENPSLLLTKFVSRKDIVLIL